MKKLGSIIILYWENNTRWYEAEIYLDLLKNLLLIQRWGGKYNSLHGKKTHILPNLKTGLKFLHKINIKRKKRKNPYQLKQIRSFFK